jgi:hypothetical protein
MKTKITILLIITLFSIIGYLIHYNSVQYDIEQALADRYIEIVASQNYIECYNERTKKVEIIKNPTAELAKSIIVNKPYF